MAYLDMIPEGHGIDDVVRDFILFSLAKCGGNRTRTAKAIKMPLRTLVEKIRNYRACGFFVPDNPRQPVREKKKKLKKMASNSKAKWRSNYREER